MPFRILFRVLAVFGSLMMAPALTVAQEVCAEGYPETTVCGAPVQ